MLAQQVGLELTQPEQLINRMSLISRGKSGRDPMSSSRHAVSEHDALVLMVRQMSVTIDRILLRMVCKWDHALE